MLSSIVGSVDVNSAWVLVIFFITCCVATTAYIVKRQIKEQLEYNYKLAHMKQEGEIKVAMLNAEASRDYKMKQLDQNLITSHKSGDTPHVAQRSDD